MLIWNKQAPKLDIDYNIYKPFIKNEWFRDHYMWFAYGLMVVLLAAAWLTGGLRAGTLLIKVLLYIAIYPVHELLHIAVAIRKGNIYLTHSGLYFWLTPDIEMSKGRFWVFMSLPLLTLTAVPTAASLFTEGTLSDYLRCIAWLNAVIAGSDIINSVLILFKPSRTSFYRGFYRRREKN